MDSSRRIPAPTQLEAWLRYFDDLGIQSFYRDRESPVSESSLLSAELTEKLEYSTAISAESEPVQRSGVPVARRVSGASATPAEPALPVMQAQGSNLPIADESRHAALSPELREMVYPPPLLKADEPGSDTLERVSSDLGECTRCKLHLKRHKIVFGAGNPRADLVFVGEGPGHDEDMQGLPFVGRAGKLLTQMIEAMGLQRADVYIANIVKCRPPENRPPQEDEIATCMPFLLRQLGAIKPKIIVCLGSTAAQTLLATKKSISAFRGQWFDFQGAKLIPTYHPAYLLRNPNAKPEVWNDLKKVMAVLGLTAPPRNASRPRS